MKIDNAVKRLYTKALEGSNKSVYDLFKWKKVNVKLKNHATNKMITDMEDLEFPEHYSQTACDIIASKYFRKKGVNNDRGYEYSLKHIIHRMVHFWTEALADEKIIDDSQKAIVYDELAFMMISQMWAPNSPQWFNTGLFHAYDIEGPAQGHFYYDENKKEVVLSENAFTRTQGSACFIISIEDSLIGEKSLTDQITTETLLFKYGSGVGTNWSPIRAINESLSGGGKSSGLLSFLKVSDRNAGAIKSGGTTRRAAKMNILNLDHPEILDFILWKAKEEEKVKALGKMGYSTGFEGEAYETVSGQNANNSIRIPNRFMESIGTDKTWQLKGRLDPSADREISVSEIWDKTAYAAWRCGDPGVQFDDTINAWHTCPCGEDGKYGAPHNRINASNPCSEYMFLDDTACNLASINIVRFYNQETGEFDITGYLHCVFFVQLVLEATIHWGQFPTKDIARKSYLFRTTGIGLSSLGELFMLMGIPYDSDEARAIAASFTSLMTGESYVASALMAEKVGAFSCYDMNKNHMLEVIKNHARAARYSETDTKFHNMPVAPHVIDHNLLKNMDYPYISESLKEVWQKAIEEGVENGYRNAQVSVLAPTGTISFAMDCATTSSEPFFSHIAYKKLAGGGFMEIINPSIAPALKKLGYKEEEIKDIIDYVMRKEEVDGYSMIADGKIEGAPHLKTAHYAVFDTANPCGTGNRYISPMGHIKMMAALTPHVTGAISKTVNLPNSATADDIKDIYMDAWKMGIKAIALYRDGCKESQPLNSVKTDPKEKRLEDMTYKELLEYAKTAHKSEIPLRVKPKGIRNARVHEAAINGLKLYITTSYYEDGRLGELYVSSGKQGSLTKGLLDSISTTISKMLQYGVPPEDIASMYRGQKFEPSGYVTGHPYIKFVDSISDLISKIIDIELGNYKYCQVKPEGYKEEKNLHQVYNHGDFVAGAICPNCQSEKMVKNGTCYVCTECGTTTGCS
jgi:ribonucleoside-diphosphate reductase alpha chain